MADRKSYKVNPYTEEDAVAAPKEEKKEGFAITQEIAFIEYGFGEDSPGTAAMRAIDEHVTKHGAPGRFHFPNEFGGTTTVEVGNG